MIRGAKICRGTELGVECSLNLAFLKELSRKKRDVLLSLHGLLLKDF